MTETREEFMVTWESRDFDGEWKLQKYKCLDPFHAREFFVISKQLFTRRNHKFETRTVTTTAWEPSPVGPRERGGTVSRAEADLEALDKDQLRDLARRALLQCPFCGRPGNITNRASTREESPSGMVWFIFCHGDGYSAHAHQWGHSYAHVASKWNQRTGEKDSSSDRPEQSEGGL